MRLDAALFERGFFPSRQKAKEALVSGNVSVDGVIRTKPSFDVKDGSRIEIVGEVMDYVGRGALKLKKILELSGISLSGMVCMDIGASTGGFTEVMLRNGASYVYAVDVGTGQLAESLCEDERVLNMEKTDIRNVEKSSLCREPKFISADVSFISLSKIFPKIYELLGEGGLAAVLIKPQFEAGRENVGKKGIVKDPRVHERVLCDMLSLAQSIGFGIMMLDFSPVQGGSGNIEYLMLMKKASCEYIADVKAVVRAAFDNFKRR